jgi:hypothetical protein
VDERAGCVRGRNTGMRINIGDVVTARIVKVDLPRRELDLAIIEVVGRAGRRASSEDGQQQKKGKKQHRKGQGNHTRVTGGAKQQVLKRRRRRHG